MNEEEIFLYFSFRGGGGVVNKGVGGNRCLNHYQTMWQKIKRKLGEGMGSGGNITS